MRWEVDVEMEMTAVRTFMVEAESRSEAIDSALKKAMNEQWDEPSRKGFHLRHIDIA